ncbi:MAG TPA: hypothetical protein VJS20_08360, partial [Gemmatimonadales bacterium]|nr:hypothetical protein [Gemmatimonadales bacterium]
TALTLISVLANLLFPITLLAQDSWTPTPLTDAPSARTRQSAVWTGQEMIVWGGDDFVGGPLSSGGKYDPATNSWTATSLVGAPVGRYQPTAIWTGTEMIVWGGHDSSTLINTGGRYDPRQDRWTSTSVTGAPSARNQHTAVWTGNVMIVWGGYEDFDSGLPGVNDSNTTNTGGRYDPVTNTWAPVSTVGAPSARFGHTAVWTGTEMIVWGGVDGTAIPNSVGVSYANNHLGNGARYNPLTDTWTPLASAGSPPATMSHSAIWTGTEMIVWGGHGESGYVNSGGRYSPQLDAWTMLPTLDAPTPREGQTAVWTGQEMIVWGGAWSSNEATGARYSVANDSWVATTLSDAPDGRNSHSAVWTGNRMVVWGGTTNNGSDSDTGAVYETDGSLPVVGRVDDGSGADDQDDQEDQDPISAKWTGFGDPESGIARYEWAIGTKPGATDVMPFTDVGSATEASAPGLVLETGKIYYATVRATNGAGGSVTATSDGVLIGGNSKSGGRCSSSAAPRSGSPLAALAIVVLLAAGLDSRKRA